MEKNLTTGSVFKNVVLFSLPYLLSYFLQTLYGMADLFIIGQFEGVASTTAVSIGSQVMHMITVMIVGLSMGTTVSVGQAVGAGDRKQAAHNIGIPFITSYNIISSIFRGLGDSKSPMCFIATACAANIALDYLFMGVLHLGPAGAALGTTLSQAISVVVSLTVILKRRSIVLKKSDFKPCRAVMGKILGIGIPIAFQDGLIQVAFIIITIIANQRGLNDAAAVGIVEKVISFLFLVPSSMLSTVSALGAQNIGAGKPERAIQTLRYAVMLAAGFGVLASIAIQFTAEGIVSLFTDPSTADGAAVVRFGGQYLRGYIFDCIFAGIHFSFSGFFCACRKSGLSFLHNILAIVLMRVPGVYVTSKLFPATLLPMGLAIAAGSLLSVVICLIAFGVIRRKSTLVLVEE